MRPPLRIPALGFVALVGCAESIDLATSSTTDPGSSASDPGEPTDTGASTTDATTTGTTTDATTPEPAVCGDGVVQAPEPCDDGNLDNTDACLDTCTPAACGDGFTHAGNEECDYAGEASTCDADCTAVSCGDGYVNKAYEACDDGNQAAGDGCENDCSVTPGGPPRVVFVTSQTFTGELGGLAGADAKCQALADAAGLPGTFMAWLSDETGSPSTRMTRSKGPYVLPDGTVVADSWDALTVPPIAPLKAAITMTEAMGIPPMLPGCKGFTCTMAWSNTKPWGDWAGVNGTCTNWTSIEKLGSLGIWAAIDGSWSDSGSVGCFLEFPLYCFQQ